MTLVTPQPLDQEEDEEMLVPHSEVVEGPRPVQGPVAFDGTPPIEAPQPMEVVGQPEGASTVDNQAIEEPQVSRFTWAIENFSRLTNKKLYSDIFVVGGYKWRVLIFPKGNNVDHLSMYLDVADSSSLPYGWSRYAQFSLAVVNQIHSKFTVKKARLRCEVVVSAGGLVEKSIHSIRSVVKRAPVAWGDASGAYLFSLQVELG
ncbi:hypothetical protein M8C21_016430 [Ambrosia artemisiifolia]|uniref:MATH domain-containing protein n=1 Tax=Ambrosia artemisiifolia TaxID=4212 RepID=A0AAD5GE39_AMBAR|nr:hypothetical protein M8C21_016430 [Ambrosia artemisiifolia]